ncbi:MAG: phosphoribosylformylglycinamidine cyclo-ligase [Thermoplasmata archaeon]
MATRHRRTRTRTYAESGVDRSAIVRALTALLAEVHGRPPSSHGRLLELPGHFAGIVRIGQESIAATTDTVGTKVLLADRMNRWEEVGEDLVAINVNDLAAIGARPAALLDTIVCARPDPARFRSIGRGLQRGLVASRCSLLGGETAVVPDLVHDIDLGATGLGFFPRGRSPVTGARTRAGDRLIGLPSTGVHSNGYTLLRRVLEEGKVDPRRPRPGSRIPVGVELLRPTRIYSEMVDAIADHSGVHGLAHLSGGGVRNLVRLRSDVRFELDRWPIIPPLFDWVRTMGGIAPSEMFQTFNMGIGFVVAVAPAARETIVRLLARHGAPDAVEIGRVRAGRGVSLPGLGLEYDTYS